MRILIFLLLFLSLFSNAKEEIKMQILSSELLTKYEVIGPLSVKLGEMVNIKAKVITLNVKGGGKLIKISELNGAILEKPIEMDFNIYKWGDIKELKVGKTYKLRGYQHGFWDGIPYQAMKDSVMVQSRGYCFRVKIILVNFL